MIQAVIFDMDGVIADSEPIHVKAEKELFLPYGVALEDEELQRFMGFGIEPMLKKLIEKYGVPVRADALYAVHRENLLRLMRQKLEPVPGALELIRLLHHGGVSLALATSSFREMADMVTRKFGIEKCFRTVMTVEDISRSKPDPEIFLKASAEMGFGPKECLVVEDSTNGVRAARAAGMTCIGLRNPNSGRQNHDGADVVVDSLRQVTPGLLLPLGLRLKPQHGLETV
jgi:HAD superfamily hydrolase (TIGR01509 family)